jgi:hypothetical protein
MGDTGTIMIVYRLWNTSYTNRRFVDVWGVSRPELETIPGIDMVIGPSCLNCFSIMFEIQRQKSTVDILVGMGAVSLDTVQKPSTDVSEVT